jgi:prephenate dehydrogenase
VKGPDGPGLPGEVLVVGTGLIGTSVGMALTSEGSTVRLSDASPGSAALAADLGAGRVRRDGDPDPRLVVVAVPPDAVAGVVAAQLVAFPGAVVTDVASVKSAPLAALRAVDGMTGSALARYVGGHPMAGRESSGPAGGRTDLFVGRPWVLAPHAGSSDDAVRAVRDLALEVGAVPVTRDPEAHDAAVALVSHVPQVVSSLLAARLLDAHDSSVELAGQGLRDMTRIAASDPGMWSEIVVANRDAVVPLLEAYRDDLAALIDDLASGAGRAAVARTVETGRLGVGRVPGKHGGAAALYAVVGVLVPDEPGLLARLLTDIGDAGINLEDLRLEHSLDQPVGSAHVSVRVGERERLEAVLLAQGWRLTAADD